MSSALQVGQTNRMSLALALFGETSRTSSWAGQPLDPRLDDRTAGVEPEEVELAPLLEPAPARPVAVLPDPLAGAEPDLGEPFDGDAALVVELDDLEPRAAAELAAETAVGPGLLPRPDLPQDPAAHDVGVDRQRDGAGPFNDAVDPAG